MQKIIDFILGIDRLKGVDRKVRPIGMDRLENPAEHSWQIALLALMLAPYANTTLDLDRVIRMLLVHDLGEVDAGDTFVFAEQDTDSHKAQERKGVNRLFADFPIHVSAPFLEMWNEFEEEVSAEALFAHAVDRAMPVLLKLANKGGSWREHGISFERVIHRVGPQIEAGCAPLWQYIKGRLDEARLDGWFASGRHA